MRTLKYAFTEAVASVWRTRASALLSVATIAASLLIFGTFLLVTANLEQFVSSWSSAAEMSVYLQDDLSEGDRTAIEQVLGESDIVEAREYVSKSEALSRFRRDFQDLESIASSFPDNPFPASFEVRLRPGSAPPTAVEDLSSRLRAAQGVADLRLDRRWIERLGGAVTLFTGLAIAFAGVLIVGSALTVSNVVRLAVHARRQEIEIMRLVGAPTGYVIGPFLAEGALQGGLGALLALAGLWLGFLVTRQEYGSLTADVLGLTSFRFLSFEHGALIVLGGTAVGCLGGVLATWGAILPRQPKAPPDAVMAR